MMVQASAALLVSWLPFLLFPSVQAGGEFITPPEEDGDQTVFPVYQVGDTLSISWSDNYTLVTLIINQLQSPATEIDYLPDTKAINFQSYDWEVRIDGSHDNPTFDLLFNNQFNFMLFETNANTPFAVSSIFNISNSTVDGQGRLISTSSASATATLSSSSRTSRTHSASTTPAAPDSATTSASASSSAAAATGPTSSTTGVAVGIGVGVGVGGLLLVGAALLVYFGWWRRRRRQEQQGDQFHNPDLPPGMSNYNYTGYHDIAPKYAPQPPVELPEHRLSELPGHPDMPTELPNR